MKKLNTNDLADMSATTLYTGEPCGGNFNFAPAFASLDRVCKPEWNVVDRSPISRFSGVGGFRIPDGNFKKLGGDIHSTVDANPFSPTFGNLHSTMRIPGIGDFHNE